MPAVSVLMPTYNAENTIEEALSSLLAQTLDDIEIIIVDDGSTDNTLHLISKWEKADGRIKVVPQEHQGIIAALNNGLRLCQSPLIARMDADDRCHPTRLEKQVNYLKAHQETALVSCLVKGFPAQNVREGFQIYINWLNSLTTNQDIRREIFIESPLPHPSVVYRKAWIARVGGYQDHGWAEDYDLWLRLYLLKASFAKIPEVLIEWREHANRLTRVDPRYSLENFLRCKAYYLTRGPLASRDAIIIWGAGMFGRRLSKYLLREGIPITAFIDVDKGKIGKTLRGLPIYNRESIPKLWSQHQRPILLSAVGARGARKLIRKFLNEIGLEEETDWLAVA